ncbi:MAG: hypothetical protein KGS45_13630 [Planctomycetes bacterium]|nr:hypothetical protein [Planctomycetota bacterium]
MTATTKLQPPLASTTCPYCGVELGSTGDSSNRCFSCRGLLDPLSRQASQNDMGPWFIRDDKRPFRPGCSFEVLRALVLKGRLSKETIIRGPSTRQFWMTAAQTPGIGHLFGSCHSCGTECSPSDITCDECHAGFIIESNRQHLGLGPIHLLPGTGMPPQSNPKNTANHLKSLVGDSIDEEQLIAAAATTLPRDELPESHPELRSSYDSPRRGDAGVISSAELRQLENRLSNARLLTLVTTLVAGLAIAATVLTVMDIKQDLGLGLGRALKPSAATTIPVVDAPVDNLSVPVATPPTVPPADSTSVTDPTADTPRPRTRGIAGSSSQPSVLPSTAAASAGPHDKPTPDGEQIPRNSPADSRWDQVANLLKVGDRDAILKALDLVNELESAKVPPPASRPELPQAVRTKAALMTLKPADPQPAK